MNPISNARPASVKRTFTPAEFAESHSAVVADVLDRVSKSSGAKTLNNNLHLAVGDAGRNGDADAKMIYDNLRAVSDTRKGAMKLSDAREIDRQLVEGAVAQAAKSTGGVLNSESARFLPRNLREDFESLSGQTISDKAGMAVDGITVKTNGAQVDIGIEFEKAMTGISAQEAILGLTENLEIKAIRLPGVKDASLPPYELVASARDGKLPSDTWSSHGGGWSGFTGGEYGGTIISAGGDKLILAHNAKDEQTFLSINFNVDKVNDYGPSLRPVSEATKGPREAWETLAPGNGSGFDFAAGLKSGALESKTLEEVREVRGSKVLFGALRDAGGHTITKLYKDGLLEFAVDPKTNTLAALTHEKDKKDQFLCILDMKKGRWVGTWAVAGDGTKEWRER